MALQVWLPLNNETKFQNNGLADIGIENHGAAFNVIGKCGTTFHFDGNDDYISIVNENYKTWFSGDFSICMWVYADSVSSSARDVLFGNYGIGSGFSFNIEIRYGYFRFYWNNNPDWITTTTISQAEWTHLTFTKHDNTVTVYKNGVLSESSTINGSITSMNNVYYLGRDNRTGTTAFAGRLNDFRIYNHCLSTKEIKEISQCLVCHYKLDDNVQVLDNCFAYPTFNTSTATGGWNHWGTSGYTTYTTYGQNTDKKYIYRKGQQYSHWFALSSDATVNYLILHQSPAFDGGFRSVQFIVKEENSKPIDESICIPSWNDNASGGAPQYKWTRIINLGDGFYLCQCDGFKQNGNNDLVSLLIYPGVKLYVSEAYLENGKKHCSDILFHDPSTVYDSSGFGNNATAVGNVTISYDTPRNSCALNFEDNAYIKKPGFVFDTKYWTTSVWYYKPTNPTAYEVLFCLSKGDGSDTNKKICAAPNSGKIWYKGESGSGSISKLNIAQWTMLTMSCDGTKVRIYENAVQIGTLNAGTQLTDRRDLVLAARSAAEGVTNTSVYFTGMLSDFRIYATSLSEDDIEQLYEVPASIDNLGNIHANEFVEDESNQELLAQWNSSAHQNHVNTGKWTSWTNDMEWYLSGTSQSFGTTYIPVSPTGKTYYYDMTLSVNAGNQAYVGFCRFDENHGTGSNEGCVYVYTTKPSSDIVKQRYFGTVNLGTTINNNPIKYITLRVLSGWTGSTDSANATMTIHSISLREVNTATGLETARIIQAGIASSDSVREYDGNARFTKNGFIDAKSLIEQ